MQLLGDTVLASCAIGTDALLIWTLLASRAINAGRHTRC